MEINQINPVPNQTFAARSPAIADSPQVYETPVSLATNQANSSSLSEIQSAAPTVDSGSNPDAPSLVLKSDSGSGNLYVKVATAIYALNHSFDEQQAVLDLIA